VYSLRVTVSAKGRSRGSFIFTEALEAKSMSCHGRFLSGPGDNGDGHCLLR